MSDFSVWPKAEHRVQVTHYSRSWWKPIAFGIFMAIKYWAEDCIFWLENSGKIMGRETYDMKQANAMLNEHYRKITDDIETTHGAGKRGSL